MSLASITSRADSRSPIPRTPRSFKEIANIKLKTRKISAFGMTRRRGIKAEDDPGMKALLEAKTPVVTIVGKSSEFQVRKSWPSRWKKIWR